MKWFAIFAILLSGIAFAQGINDIGRTLFVELLGARNYPGSPFSGNPVNDIILFFLVPTILIIMIIYMMVGRIFPSGYKSLRLLLGVGAYLFIIASGYFGFFMQLAGPTFIFFIFILGVLFFFLEFFTGRGRGGGGPAQPGQPGRIAPYGGSENPYTGWGLNALRRELNKTNDEIKKVDGMINHEESRVDKLIRTGAPGARVQTESGALSKLRERMLELETRKTNIEYAMGAFKGKW